jgi:XTP/dITP diphosphohydrolase
MTQKIVIASTNRHKIREIKQILDFSGFTFHSLEQYSNLPEAVEDASSFEENAIIKAKHYYEHTRLPVIADDSGLVIPALNGEPGVYSARYAGEGSTYPENNALLLSRMEDLAGNDRSAYFVCNIVFYDGKKLVSAEGRAEGEIIISPRGKSGFGYDPLFYYPSGGKTFAEMTAEEKNKVSHRSRALQSLREKLEDILMIKP